MKINSKETLWVTYYSPRDEPLYCVTSDKLRSQYKLYKIDSDKLVLLKKAETLINFEKYIKV